MSRAQDRKNIVKEINQAADFYRKYLVGKRFLYAFDSRYIEVIFKIQNFKHLTGVATNLNAKPFYKLAVQGKLSASQIWFDANHPYDLCVRKAKHLAEIATMVSSENFMLEEIRTDKKTFKFGTTDLNFTICMDHEYDDNGNIKGDCYVAESLRDEDCFSKSTTAYEVTHILTHPNDQKLYTTALFIDKRYTLNDLPDSIKMLLDEELLKSNQTSN